MLKLCIRCKINKPTVEYHIRTNGKLNNTCRKCQNIYFKKRYENNKSYFADINLKTKTENIRRIHEFKINKPCLDCGKIYEPFCMDFDHQRDKFKAISLMVRETHSWDRILKEIEKCELVCVLCHKNRTYLRLQEKTKKETKYTIRNKKLIHSLKDVPCRICNIKYKPWQMEFDHILTKVISVGKLLNSSIKRIMEEAAKCQILCALCHRVKTKRELWD